MCYRKPDSGLRRNSVDNHSEVKLRGEETSVLFEYPQLWVIKRVVGPRLGYEQPEPQVLPNNDDPNPVWKVSNKSYRRKVVIRILNWPHIRGH